jgi:ribosomal protein L11 methyltransferase
MPTYALVLELAAEGIDAFSDALLEAGAAAVEIEDADAQGPHERAAYAAPGEALARLPARWRRTRLRVLLESDRDAAGLLERASRAAGVAAPDHFSAAALDDRDWVRATQAQFPSLAIGRRLWIVPSWHSPPRGDVVVVRIDPGRAFGTGSHATTRLVLEWLERELRPGARVLDYGCGSGILAIAAARLGAAEVDVFDIDREALDVCLANARDNAVALRIRGLHEAPQQGYDVVVANILAGPLIELASQLAQAVGAGGRIGLSGVLEEQADEVCAAYGRDLALRVAARSEGWVLLAGGRP